MPCHSVDPELFFAESPAQLELAKDLCTECPVRRACLAGALARREAAGVWGGQIFDNGERVANIEFMLLNNHPGVLTPTVYKTAVVQVPIGFLSRGIDHVITAKYVGANNRANCAEGSDIEELRISVVSAG